MRALLMTLAAAVFSIPHAQASSITYTPSTTATGTLGGTLFTNALVTVTLTADTANVVPGPAPYTGTAANAGTATVNVAGIGTGTFTSEVGIFSSLNDVAALALLGGNPGVIMIDATAQTGILVQIGPVFSTYDLRSSLGPITGPGGPASGSQITPVFSTTAGDFTWAVGQTGGQLTSTFTAVTTPEPAPFLLLGSALAVVLARSRFRRDNR